MLLVFIILILVVVAIILLMKRSSKENFQAFNVFNVDLTHNIVQVNNPNVLTIEQENENMIQKIESKTTLQNLDNIKWETLPYFQDLPKQNEMKAFIISYLDSLNLKDRLNTPIVFVIPLNFTNVKSIKGCKSTIYSFQCEIVNQTLNVPQSFIVSLKISDKKMSLIYIKRVKDINVFNVQPSYDNLLKPNDNQMFNLFRTKNNLYLFEPFKTSANDP